MGRNHWEYSFQQTNELYRFESCPDYTVPKQTTDSVPHTMRNGVMTVGERTLTYRENVRECHPDLVRTK